MRAATKEKPLADTTPQDLFPICELSVERVPLIIRQQVSTLFGRFRANYEGIFVHLLRYAHVQDDTAIIRIPNQWKFHQQDGNWPCCYATLNTFIRLLCAVGILQPQPRETHRSREYHLALTDYEFPLEAIATLDRLMDPAWTKNQKVRHLAEKVKSRIASLDGNQLKDAVRFDSVDSCHCTTSRHIQQHVDALLKALHDTQQHLEALGEIHKQLLTQISQMRMESQATDTRPASRFSDPIVDNSSTSLPAEDLQREKQAREKDAQQASAPQRVDSEGSNRAKSRPIKVDAERARNSHLLLLSGQIADFVADESTPHLTHSSCQTRNEEQNLLSNNTLLEKGVDSGLVVGENLPGSHRAVDSDQATDNDRYTFSHNLLKGNTTHVIDGKARESTTERPRPLYRPIDARTAHLLAQFVEGNPQNFRSYITLSQKYHPQIIRAAILNMLAHSYFPDVDGDLPADQDGELTGKIGRPRKPGAWVTSCCQAYAQHGLPQVMRLLLQVYDGSYDEIRQRMEVLSRALAPKRFWAQWQEDVLTHQLGEISSAQEPLPRGESGADRDNSTHLVLGGMPSSEVHELVKQINREAQSYGITARPCLQNGQWEAEIELRSQMRTSTYQFHSKQEWEQYFVAIQQIPLATNGKPAL